MNDLGTIETSRAKNVFHNFLNAATFYDQIMKCSQIVVYLENYKKV